MTGYPDTFEGFTIKDAKKWTDFTKEKIQPKIFEDYDVDIENECCGVCGSDVHTITGGWGELPPVPVCVGHEIIGKVLKVGPKVKDVQVGDRVGVGAQVQSCMQCPQCKSNNENYCPHQVDTYGAPYKVGGGDPSKDPSKAEDMKINGKQVFSQGGYSSHSRVHQQFVFKVPDGIRSEEAGPMMCAGLTTFGPLKRAGVGPGKHVAILGIGGLGHFGLLWAKALGAEVTALSHTANKESDAKKLGADHFVLTSDKNWHEPLAFKFNFILNCADATDKFDLSQYMSTLAVNGEFHNVGLPDNPLPQIQAFVFAPNGSKIAGSHIGSKQECLEMLKLAVEKDVHPMIETIDISKEGCAKAVTNCKENKVRYRTTLVGFHQAFGTGKA